MTMLVEESFSKAPTSPGLTVWKKWRVVLIGITAVNWPMNNQVLLLRARCEVIIEAQGEQYRI